MQPPEMPFVQSIPQTASPTPISSPKSAALRGPPIPLARFQFGLCRNQSILPGKSLVHYTGGSAPR
jgi:hypothetical protein